jgi:DNA processing protein
MQGMDPPRIGCPGPPSDRALLVALNTRLDLARAAICRLGAELARWRDLAAPQAELARELSMDLDTLSKALDMRREASGLERRADRRAAELEATLHSLADPTYPEALRTLALPPPAVHLAGELDAFALPAVAIVGSRQASPYGVEVATWLATELSRSGLVVVSGFARGIDAAAHRGALRAEGGRTIAVLGCGLARDYPPGQRALAAAIRERGALLSEFPCDAPPERRNFPVRNRIIAALAGATIVVEAAPRSGSLITARLALDLGREVLAVPGRVTDELALGTNELLRDGATPVTHPADVLEALGWGEPRNLDSAAAAANGVARRRDAEPALPPGLPAAARSLYAALERDLAQAPELLSAAAGLPVDRALGALLELELSGLARREPGGLYRRR